MIYDLQKASLFKRFSAFLFDAIMLVTVAVALSIGVSAILGYSNYTDAYQELKTEYSDKYGITFDITAEELEALGEDEMAKYNAANEEWTKDPRVVFVYTMMTNLSLAIVSLSLFVAFLGLEFVVPLLFGNGQTLGKKVFGVGVMMINGTKIKPVALFIRSILAKYAVETMIPVFIMLTFVFGTASIFGVVTLAAILIVEVAMLIATKTNSALHDGLSSTVTVDFASQLIFEDDAALMEYKKKLAQDKAASEDYYSGSFTSSFGRKDTTETEDGQG